MTQVQAQTQDGGDAILEAFRNLGIDYIISSPGSEWAPVWESLARQKINETDGPTYINCWHETLAVDMALGYTRVTGRMQAVLLHAGVGLLQGGVGIHGAYLGEVPMLVCSGEATSYGENPALDPQGQWYRNLSVVGGPNRFVEPFVKWSGQATSPYTLYEQLVRAGEMAQRVPKGPTFLDIPIETMIHGWTPPAKIRPVAPAPRTQPATDSIDRLASLIAGSSKPLIITEGSGQPVAGFDALVSLAELMAIPVVESASTYANFPKSHPLYLGGNAEPFMHQADLVLLLGSRSPWYPPNAGPANAKVVALGENPLKGQMAYQNLLADMYVEGDLTIALQLLTQALESNGAAEAPTPAKLRNGGNTGRQSITGWKRADWRRNRRPAPSGPSTRYGCAPPSVRLCPTTQCLWKRLLPTGARLCATWVGTGPKATSTPTAAWARGWGWPWASSWLCPTARW